jgi:peptidoglycan/xylan/chitin deacetylase (PgdA/CDA1 family)
MIVIITVDVEGAHSRTPVESLIYGKIGGEEYGINGIMDLCDHFQIKASFFVDVYEYALHGTPVMKQIVKNIVSREHDTQLHTHPAWPLDDRDEIGVQKWKATNCLYDPQRPWMYQYGLEEQIGILNHGKKMLEKWIGNTIVAHRAGGYGANKTTLEALKSAGLKMDFSAFRGQENCRLKVNANTITILKEIVEVPVTGFFRPSYVRFPRLPFRRRFVKTDIDWAFLDELKFFYEQGKKNGLNMMVLFMHSFSFVKYSPNFDYFEPDQKEIRRFEEFIQFALKNDAEFMTANEFWKVYQSNPKNFQKRDYIPTYIKS